MKVRGGRAVIIGGRAAQATVVAYPDRRPHPKTMTDSALTLAQPRLLLPGGLDPAGLDRAFGTLLGPGIDFGDLYFQHSRRESWTVEDGIVKDGAHSIEQGVGVRAISGEKTGFAYSDDINADALRLAAGSARAIASRCCSMPSPMATASISRAMPWPLRAACWRGWPGCPPATPDASSATAPGGAGAALREPRRPH